MEHHNEYWLTISTAATSLIPQIMAQYGLGLMTPGTILTNIMDGYGTETKAINTVIAHLKEVENASLSLLFIEQTQVSMF